MSHAKSFLCLNHEFPVFNTEVIITPGLELTVKPRNKKYQTMYLRTLLFVKIILDT